MQDAGVPSVLELLQHGPREVHRGALLVLAVEVLLELVQTLPRGEQAVVLRHDDRRDPFLRRVPAHLVLGPPLDQPVRRAHGRRRVTNRWRQPVKSSVLVHISYLSHVIRS